MPNITPKQSCLGCVTLLSMAGGFVAGLKVGYAHSNGIDLSSLSALEGALLTGPTIITGITARMGAQEMISNPSNVEELSKFGSSILPPEYREQLVERQRENIHKNYTTSTPIIAAGMAAAATAVGYYIGSTLAR